MYVIKLYRASKETRMSTTTRTRSYFRPQRHTSLIIILLSIIIAFLANEASATEYREKKQVNGTEILWELHIPNTGLTYSHLPKRPEYTLNGIVLCLNNDDHDTPVLPSPPASSPSSTATPKPGDPLYDGPPDLKFWPNEKPSKLLPSTHNHPNPPRIRRGGPAPGVIKPPPPSADNTHTYQEPVNVDPLDAFLLLQHWQKKFPHVNNNNNNHNNNPERVTIPHGEFGNSVFACSTTLRLTNTLDQDEEFDVRWVDERIMAVFNMCTTNGLRGLFISEEDGFNITLVRTPGRWQYDIDQCVPNWLTG